MFYTYVYRDPSRLNTKGFPEEIYVGKGRDKRQAQLARFANPEEKQKLIDRTIASWKKRK